ncbi:hypothetical protein [Microvirga sp. M2]|uniref:hypothetical protein n=1 Tax=Microvirga sp. M2 TaxID=3073270 RepID=UPI0039C39D01
MTTRHDGPIWRHDVDALAFRPRGHEGFCFIHRLAFRSLSGEGGRDICEAYFRTNRDAFERAAQVKMSRVDMPAEQNFHLTSRDIRRALAMVADP